MKKWRRRLILATAIVAVLAIPEVHWRLIGWAKGEPFFHGRPASFWRAEILGCTATISPNYLCGFALLSSAELPSPNLSLRRNHSRVSILLVELALKLNMDELAYSIDAPPFSRKDTLAVPVLISLLADTDPLVRYFAVQKLGYLDEASRPALQSLISMTADRSVVRIELEYPYQGDRQITVADAILYALWRIDPDGWKAIGPH